MRKRERGEMRKIGTKYIAGEKDGRAKKGDRVRSRNEF